MLTLLKKLERIIISVLIIFMVVVVLLSTIELGWIIAKDIYTPPVVLLEIDELLDIFGFFLLVLIGVELLETIRSYLDELVIHAEVVVEVAIIAIARKIIILDVKAVSSQTLMGVAAILTALTLAFYVLKRWRGENKQQER